MLEEDAQSHEDQDDTADQLGLGLEFRAEEVADIDTDGREGEGDHADEGDGGGDGDLQEGKGHAHGQGVDAGGHRHGEHGLGAEGAIALLGFAEGFLDHIRADEPQQNEGDPMIHRLYVGLELASQEITQEGHGGLESAEIQSCNDSMAEF